MNPNLRQLIDSMVETKKITREMGTGPVPLPLAEYMDTARIRYADLSDRLDNPGQSVVTERYRIAQDFYRTAVANASMG